MNPFEAIRARYEEPHRHHHTLLHVNALLAGLQAHMVLAQDAGVIEAAIWYHDAIYNTRRNDNEERSAVLARDDLARAGWPMSRVARVESLVRATAHHQAPPDDADAWLFLDLDLCILGQSTSAYDRYRDAIRREYDWVEDSAYRSGRKRVLESFLNRPVIFQTDVVRAAFEIPARDNIRREIEQLG